MNETDVRNCSSTWLAVGLDSYSSINIRSVTSGRSQQWHICAMVKFWNVFVSNKSISAKAMG
jgi:hypothetical protein